MVLLAGKAISTQLREQEEDIEVTPHFKNPLLQKWKSQLFSQQVLHNMS